MSKSNSEWISVNEELPEKTGHCLVRWDDGEIAQGLFIAGNKAENISSIFFGEGEGRVVTHWQPYPLNSEVCIKRQKCTSMIGLQEVIRTVICHLLSLRMVF